MGHVRTRVCRRGSLAIVSHQASNLACIEPCPCSHAYKPSAKRRAPDAVLTASRNAIFSNENKRLVRASMRSASTATSSCCPAARNSANLLPESFAFHRACASALYSRSHARYRSSLKPWGKNRRKRRRHLSFFASIGLDTPKRKHVRRPPEYNRPLAVELSDTTAARPVRRAHRTPIHLLITDVVMPVFPGRMVAEEIR